jgi:anaerobic C4-dicarboxylate transporter
MIQIVMAVVATVIIAAMSVKPADVVKAPTFTSGMVAIIALFGIAWLAQTSSPLMRRSSSTRWAIWSRRRRYRSR